MVILATLTTSQVNVVPIESGARFFVRPITDGMQATGIKEAGMTGSV